MITEIKELFKTCSACPSQWEGWTTDDRQIYIRYRWGYLTVRLGEKGDKDEFAAVRGEQIFEAEVGGEFDGTLSDAELQNLTKDVLIFPTESK